MEVYILNWDDYEAHIVHGVFSTLEKAIDACPVKDTEKCEKWNNISKFDITTGLWTFGDTGYNIEKYEIDKINEG